MTIEASHNPAQDVFTIRIRGRFDFSTHESFRAACEQRPDARTRVVVDLSQAEYLDSSALGMLLILRRDQGREPVVLRGAQPAVAKILRIANFQQLFAVE